jgi:hypothetical protein
MFLVFIFVILPAFGVFVYFWSHLLGFWSDKVAEYVPLTRTERKCEIETENGVTNSPLAYVSSNIENILKDETNQTQEMITQLINDDDPEPHHKSCNEGHFYCDTRAPWESKRKLLAWTTRCDGVFNCWDKSDERNCSHCLTTFSCPTEDGKYRLCLKSEKLCDKIADCPDKSDELLYCNRKLLFFTSCFFLSGKECEANEIRCLGKGGNYVCFPPSFRCDGERHCLIGQDEDDCPWCQGIARPCDKGGRFLMCVSIWDLCDGHSHCGDNFDEQFFNCNSTSTCPGACHVTSSYEINKERDYNHNLRE